MNRIYIEPPNPRGVDSELDAIERREWRADQVSKLYEAIAKLQFLRPGTSEIDTAKLGEMLLAMVKLAETR